MRSILIIIATFSTILLTAQNPTYEQTVDYIKTQCDGRMLYRGPLDSYNRATGHKLRNVEIQKDGTIKLLADQKYGIHDFDIVFNIFDLKESIEYPEGVRAYNYLVHFQGLNVTNGFGITFATNADAKRVARAFRHLKSLCEKSGSGLFDEPVEEEKVVLGKQETLQYINNVLREHCGSESYSSCVSRRFSSNSYVVETSRDTWDYNSTKSTGRRSYKFNLTDMTIKEAKYGKEVLLIADKNKPLPTWHHYFEETNKYEGTRIIDETKDITVLNIPVGSESQRSRLANALIHYQKLIAEEQQKMLESDPFGN